MRSAFIILLAAFLAAPLTGCARTLNQSPVHIAQPVHDVWGAPNISRDGRFYFSGQPDPESLEVLASRGVVKVINIRSQAEMDELYFDEALFIEDLGETYDITYVHLPFPRENRDLWLDDFRRELGQTRGPVLIHCGFSSRVGAVWGRYLRFERGFNADDALLRAKAAGLKSDSLAEWVVSPVRRWSNR